MVVGGVGSNDRSGARRTQLLLTAGVDLQIVWSIPLYDIILYYIVIYSKIYYDVEYIQWCERLILHSSMSYDIRLYVITQFGRL